MKSIVHRTLTYAAMLFLSGVFLAGCASSSGKTSGRTFEDNFRFVPRVHVEDNSFGVTGGDYHHCTYDQLYEGYWCPK